MDVVYWLERLRNGLMYVYVAFFPIVMEIGESYGISLCSGLVMAYE